MTCTSKVKYFFSYFISLIKYLTIRKQIIKTAAAQVLTFLMIITRNGNLIPSVLFFSDGHSMNVVETLVPMISNTELWMSASVILLMWPFLTFLFHIWSGLDLNFVLLLLIIWNLALTAIFLLLLSLLMFTLSSTVWTGIRIGKYFETYLNFNYI
jgi:hypothetical protein